MPTFRHHPVLGTHAEVRVDLGREVDAGVARRLDEAIVAEMIRLEAVFSVYDPASELERWKRREVDRPGADLGRALAAALAWQERSAGAFNVAARHVHELWRRAERDGHVPGVAERAEVAARIADPPYRVDERGGIEPVGSLDGVDLNAFAKGWIVDRAVERACSVAADGGIDPDGIDIVVSAGGDIRHHGARSSVFGIENPLRPYDNEPPLTTVRVADAGLATSGRARRGFRIGRAWFGHAVDPRTATPVDHVASISIVAADAATADAIATVAGVESAERGPVVAERFGAACLVVASDGRRLANDRWRALSPA